MISLKNLFKKKEVVQNSKDTKKDKRELVRLTSNQKDVLTSLFSLPVNPDWLDDIVIDKIKLEVRRNRNQEIVSFYKPSWETILKKTINELNLKNSQES